MPDLVRGLDPDTLSLDDSEAETETVDEEGYQVAIATDEDTLEPVHVSEYNGDAFGSNTTLTDFCGNRQTVEGDGTGFQITVEGILTLEQVRKARSMGLNEGRVVEITLQPWTDTYTLANFSWTKPSDLNEWYSSNYPDGVPAFTFQLQSEDPTQSSSSDGGL